MHDAIRLTKVRDLILFAISLALILFVTVSAHAQTTLLHDCATWQLDLGGWARLFPSPPKG